MFGNIECLVDKECFPKDFQSFQITVNKIMMVRLANDVTVTLLFTFYFGHVTNKRDH